MQIPDPDPEDVKSKNIEKTEHLFTKYLHLFHKRDTDHFGCENLISSLVIKVGKQDNYLKN